MNPRVAPWAGWALAGALVLSLGLLLLLSTGEVLVSQRGTLGGRIVQTEFRTAWPLQPGMAVRVQGAVAGTVEGVTLTDRGTATVTLRLISDVPEPRADATASIRQGDVLGDTYVDMRPGTDPQPLGDATIGTARTVAMPRIDDAVGTFREPEREALRAVLTELGRATDRRGTDINDTMLRLRPALLALDDLFSELDGQEADLRTVIADSDRLIAQMASSDRAIDRGLVSLDQVLATTAAKSRELDRLLARSPGAMSALQRSLADVQTLAVRARPLARSLARAAPELRAAAPLIAPFAAAAGRSSRELTPAVRRLRETLVAAEPMLQRLEDVTPAELLLPASGLLQTISPIFGVGAKAFFGATSYGEKTSGEGGLGAVGVEPGNSPTTPNVDPRRGIGRIAVALSCETFGVPIRPGCLGQVLDTGAPIDPSTLRTTPRTSGTAPTSPDDRVLTEVMDYLLR